MRAIVIDQRSHGLEFRCIDEPELGDGQIRVAVRAASLNRADLAVRAGTHTADISGLAGLDAAGEVVEAGRGVTDVAVGDRVMMMVSGGLSERVVVDEGTAVRIPPEWSYIEGSAAIVGLMTAQNALMTAARMTTGESVLVHGATSAVGIQCIQLAKHLGAGRIVGTARARREVDALRALGMDELIVVDGPGWAERVQDLTHNLGIDIVLDFAGGPYLEDNIAAAALGGRIIGIGRLAGADGRINMEALAYKRLEIIGVTFRTRDLDQRRAIAEGVRQLLLAPADNGISPALALRPTVERTMAWTEVEQAYRHLAGSRGLGKIVLEMNGSIDV
ncbi:zinc-binding dehydrogenase [Nocardia sp. NPDC004860]|uniref:zinc-binding dehydrogenase n=1 Tax=Nocardia sp. NPDC004860 TaxID=3154557 RepID=UPI0033B0BEC1